MGHVRDGALRRLYDERAAVPLSARHHLLGCRRCQERYAAIVAEAQAIAVLFGVAPREESRPSGILHQMPLRGPERGCITTHRLRRLRRTTNRSTEHDARRDAG